jgi:hypothetical protein
MRWGLEFERIGNMGLAAILAEISMRSVLYNPPFGSGLHQFQIIHQPFDWPMPYQSQTAAERARRWCLTYHFAVYSVSWPLLSFPLFLTLLHSFASPNVYFLALIVEVCAPVHPFHIWRKERIPAKSEGMLPFEFISVNDGRGRISRIAVIAV